MRETLFPPVTENKERKKKKEREGRKKGRMEGKRKGGREGRRGKENRKLVSST